MPCIRARGSFLAGETERAVAQFVTHAARDASCASAVRVQQRAHKPRGGGSALRRHVSGCAQCFGFSSYPVCDTPGPRHLFRRHPCRSPLSRACSPRRHNTLRLGHHPLTACPMIVWLGPRFSSTSDAAPRQGLVLDCKHIQRRRTARFDTALLDNRLRCAPQATWSSSSISEAVRSRCAVCIQPKFSDRDPALAQQAPAVHARQPCSLVYRRWPWA